MGNALGRQQVDNLVRQVALGDPVQGNGHAAWYSDAVAANRQPAAIDAIERGLDRRRSRTSRIRVLSREVAGVKVPQRLHRNIEHSAGEYGVVLRNRKEFDHFRAGVDQNAGPVQFDERGILPIEAE